MRLFVLVRHGQSELNATQRVNGDPAVPVELTAQGEAEAAAPRRPARRDRARPLHRHRFGRTRRRPRSRWRDGTCRVEVEPLLDDIDVGDLEGETIDGYRAWKRAHARADAFPGGESLDDGGRRYAQAYERLLARASDGSSSSATRSPSATRSTRRPARTSSTAPRTRSRTAPLPLRRGRARARCERIRRSAPTPASSDRAGYAEASTPGSSRRCSARSTCRRTSPARSRCTGRGRASR